MATNRRQRALLALLTGGLLLVVPMSFAAAASPGGRLAAALAPSATPSSVAAGAHAILGSLVNGTAGAPSPSGLLVTLHGYDQFAVSLTLTTTTDSAGAFTFPNVPDVAGRFYMLSVPYEGVPYSSDLLKFDANATTLNARVQLYEVTPDTGALRVTQMHLVFDLTGDTATVTEICLLSNTSGRTFVASGGAGLTIPVPTGAAAVAVQNQQGSIAADRTAQGLRITTPLLPGPSTAELVFTFQLLGRAPAFEQSLPLPLDSLTVFVPTGGPVIQGAGVQDAGQQTFQGKPYHVFSGVQLAAGQKIAFQFSGGAASTRAPSDPNALLIIGLGLLNLVLLVGIGLLLWRQGAFRGWPSPQFRRRGRAPEDPEAPRITE